MTRRGRCFFCCQQSRVIKTWDSQINPCCIASGSIRSEDSAGRRCLAFEVFRAPHKNHFAAVVACPRPQFDHPVGLTDQIQVMLDNHQRVASIHQPIQSSPLSQHIRAVQASGRLIQKNHFARLGTARNSLARGGQMRRQFQSLGLSARKCRC